VAKRLSQELKIILGRNLTIAGVPILSIDTLEYIHHEIIRSRPRNHNVTGSSMALDLGNDSSSAVLDLHYTHHL